MSKIGYTVHSKDGAFLPHCQRLRPRAMFFMNDWGGAAEFKRLFPSCYVIHRVSAGYEGSAFLPLDDAKEAFIQLAREVQHDRVYINWRTEPDIGDEKKLAALNTECLMILDLAKELRVRVALPHFAHYRLENELWKPIEPLIDAIAATPISPIDGQPSAIATYDEYGGGHMFSGVVDTRFGDNETGHIPPEHWVRSNKPKYYHVGRVCDFYRARKAAGKQNPITVITEYGVDRLQDIENWLDTLKRNTAYPNIRGWRTLLPQYLEWYGPATRYNLTPARAFAKMMVAGVNEIYSEFPEIVGVCPYVYGTNGDSQWHSFRVDNEPDIQNELEIAQAGENIVTNPTPVPKPTNLGAQALARLKEDYRLRTGPGSAWATIRAVPAGEVVQYYPNQTFVSAGGFNWGWVDTAGGGGWMAYQTQFFRLIPPGWTAPNPIRLAVPFVSQLDTGSLNNCGEAALTSILKYIGLVSNRPQLRDLPVTAVIAQVNNAGQFADFPALLEAAAFFGVEDTNVRVNQTLADIQEELESGRPVIALIERGDIPGASAIHPFAGAHFVPVFGYNAERIYLYDPLVKIEATANNGQLTPYVNDFFEAWRETDPPNTGQFQMITFGAAEFVPAQPPLHGPFTPDELQQLADLHGESAEINTELAAITTVLNAQLVRLAEINQQLAAIILTAKSRIDGNSSV